MKVLPITINDKVTSATSIFFFSQTVFYHTKNQALLFEPQRIVYGPDWNSVMWHQGNFLPNNSFVDLSKRQAYEDEI